MNPLTMATEKASDGQADAASFLSLLEPLPDHGVSLDTARCLTARIDHLSQQVDRFDKKVNSIAESVANVVLLVQEIIRKDKPSEPPIHHHHYHQHHHHEATTPNAVVQTPPSIPIPSVASPPIPQLRREDIGRFDPGHADERGTGMVVVPDGNSSAATTATTATTTATTTVVIFTDVDLFVEHIEFFLQDPTTAPSNERQILSWLEALLRGAAAAWWSRELTREDRRALRRAGLGEVLVDLSRRFAADAAVAAVRFDHGKLGLREVAHDEHRVVQFVRAKLRWARDMRLLDERGREWLFVMLQIWFSMDLDIRGILRPPSPRHTLELYLREICEVTPALMSRALQLYP
ncbi:uncharacterized protein F4812DRAFT_467002 [Daldinia caldariorum]|uniref:uncharacterized protein n=1 Tax=Daldinia caldariorum TaxID=326644 RepID=UPI00200859C9|nr:uncharacterized protein F4812DRAFT_467002 [Daldinia caldariorum]KAI1464770.1 hypothetical protein F4812DRAFT_467002 [Daldinia caldariorum]